MSAVFGIGGALRSGKDTVADYLVEEYGWIKMGMSEPLNDALLALNPMIPVREWGIFSKYVSYEELYLQVGYTEAKTNPEVRRLLQVLGTEVGREMIDENVWVDIAKRRIEAETSRGENVIMTGMRFPNEVRMIQELEGTNFFVSRPGVDSVSSHASETSVDKSLFDIEIENDGSLGELYAELDDLLDLFELR